MAHSALYKGWISHRRLKPGHNCFRYRLYLAWLDLAELPAIYDRYRFWSARRRNLAWFRRADYMAPADRPLDVVVRDLVEQRLGRRPTGPIRLLTHLRYFGICFNPVSFYYCYDAAGSLDAIVAEVTNTPWRQRFQYVLDISAARHEHSASGPVHVWHLTKAFHVSPFLPMDMDYTWRFDEPGQSLHVYMRHERGDNTRFDSTLVLKREPLSQAALTRALVSYPFMTLKVIAMIHWQAVKLFFKRVPFFPHPAL